MTGRVIESADELRTLLVGRTIVAADREADTSESFPQGANSVTLTLDDGATVEFSGWGYDASGCETLYTAKP